MQNSAKFFYENTLILFTPVSLHTLESSVENCRGSGRASSLQEVDLKVTDRLLNWLRRRFFFHKSIFLDG